MPTKTRSSAAIRLSDVLVTHRLDERPQRPPDYHQEALALRELGAAMVHSAPNLLEKLCEKAVSLCNAGASGISLLTYNEELGHHFSWVAMGGHYKPYLGGTTPRDFSPCGTTLDRQAPQLFYWPDRLFTYLQVAVPPLVEGLVIPINSDSGPLGTIWVVHHSEDQSFDREDVRIMLSLADFCGTALKVLQGKEAAEREVEARTAALQKALDEMHAFTYCVSHDLRAPLRAMSGHANMLVEDYRPLLPEHACSHLLGISNAAARMGKLVDDLLSFSRLSRQELRKSPVDLHALVRRLQREWSTPIDVAIEPGFSALGDERMLELVLRNLLSNAVKFTSKCQDPKIHFSVEDGAFCVRDNGCGFDPIYVEKLFKPFERLHTEEEYPGTGMGLASVRRIIERHGGRVWAEPGEVCGARFYFTLPH